MSFLLTFVNGFEQVDKCNKNLGCWSSIGKLGEIIKRVSAAVVEGWLKERKKERESVCVWVRVSEQDKNKSPKKKIPEKCPPDEWKRRSWLWRAAHGAFRSGTFPSLWPDSRRPAALVWDVVVSLCAWKARNRKLIFVGVFITYLFKTHDHQGGIRHLERSWHVTQALVIYKSRT